MKNLILHRDYTRKEAHDIFDPESTFTPQAGTWGLQGVVQLPNRENDFVFFVTYGQTQGEHEFDEGIDQDGLFRWQSQPRQGLSDAKVIKWIAHNEKAHTIHLFLRCKRDLPYTYLGPLKYISHDFEREKPVHFIWQLVEWPIESPILERIGLEIEFEGTPVTALKGKPKEPQKASVEPLYRLAEAVEAPKQGTKRAGVSTKKFQRRIKKDWEKSSAQKKKIGDAGEELVVKTEVDALRELGLNELADKVRHVSKIEGDGAGYDVLSFQPDGQVKYIEVKATRGGMETDFYISPNEVAFSKEHAKNFYLVRVYNFDPEAMTGEQYVLRGALEEHFKLTPTEYRIENLKSPE